MLIIDKVKEILRKHVKVWTILISILLIWMNYFIIINLNHNHLSFTHLMYIPIVISGSLLGSLYGLGIAVLAGLVVGPIMPSDLVTGVPQFWGDWFARLLMMALVGIIAGYFGTNYRKSIIRIKELELKHIESGLFNTKYLKDISLLKNQFYTIGTLIIGNAHAICDVQGYETYYAYLRKIVDSLKIMYPSIEVVQPEIDHLWFIKISDHFDEEIKIILNIIQSSKKIGNDTLFIDYALGFTQRKHLFEKEVTKYFIQSDIAAREAKGKNLPYLTYKDVKTNRQFEYELLTDFEEALHDGEIYLVYQPKIDLKTKRPVGLEALIRWEHPIKKSIAPDQFIYAVEKTNMIHEMTQKVFEWSLMYQTRLKEHNINIPISINISTKNLYDIYFYDKMIEIFKRFQIDAKMVEFEITESLLMENPESSKRMLEALSNFGFKIAIDDFGKGYSSLAYLAQFPINTIKIDRFFTNQVLINPTTQHIVKATIDLAKQLGYEVVIEGIEDQDTANLLERLGCHTAQGYLFMRPRKGEEVLDYLKKYR